MPNVVERDGFFLGPMRGVYAFVPIRDYGSSSIDWTLPVPDIVKKLCEKYGLSVPECPFTESVIAPLA